MTRERLGWLLLFAVTLWAATARRVWVAPVEPASAGTETWDGAP